MTKASGENFPPPGLQDALAQSAVRGSFTDTAYYLYSHRLLSGRVGKARIIYGSSLVMNAAGQHFRGQLSAAFSKIQDIPADVDVDEYGYQSDSDLEDDWDVEDLRSPASTSSDSKKGKSKVENEDEAEAEDPEVKLGIPRPSGVVEHTVLVTDVAANTWEALLFYIYTGTIFFAPLRSEGAEERMCAVKQHKHDHPYRPPLCSPKSVYRLADKIGIDRLKSLAEADLKKRVSSKMILDEVFSRFSSWYPDILKVEVDFFCDHAISDARVMLGLQQKIRSIVKGELQHGDNALMSLLQKLPVRRSSPSGVPSPSPRITALPAISCNEDSVLAPSLPEPEPSIFRVGSRDRPSTSASEVSGWGIPSVPASEAGGWGSSATRKRGRGR